MRRIKLLAIACICISFILVGCTEDDDGGIDPSDLKEITIGGLIPASGAYGVQGPANLAAMQFAVEDINEDLEDRGSEYRIKSSFADTETDPNIANAILNAYLSQEIRFIIGPVTSAEVIACQEDINASGSIIISPSSTLVDLAVADDNIYRVVSDDSQMAEAVTEVMWSKGIRHLAILYRDDSWGLSLADLTGEGFTTKGGNVLGKVSFFTFRESLLRESLDALNQLVSDQLQMSSADEIAVQMISFDEGSTLMELASEYPDLASIKWFGSDGFVNNEDLFFSDTATRFAIDVQYSAPIFGAPHTDEYLALCERIRNESGYMPGIYSILCYDALMVAGNTLAEVGDDADILTLKTELENQFDAYEGISGSIEMNDAGDRINGAYYFWEVVEVDTTYKWEHTLSYENGSVIEE